MSIASSKYLLLIPFVDILIDQGKIFEYANKYNLNINFLNQSENSFLFFITISFISIILVSSFIKFLLGYLGHLISNITHEMNLRMFQNLIHSRTTHQQKSDENMLIHR